MNALRFGRFSLRYRSRSALLCLILMALVGLLAFRGFASGTVPLSALEIWHALAGSQENLRTTMVVQQVRLPRILVAIFVGFSLGVSGAVFQSMTRNPLGSPDVMGLTTGAATGALVQIILLNAGSAQAGLSAFVAGIATAVVVLLLARPKQNGATARMILMGIGLGALLSGLNTLLMAMGDIDSAMAGQIWLSGSLNARHWGDVGVVALGIVLCLPPLMIYRRQLEIAEMGEDMVRALGVRLPRLRIVTILSGVGLAAAATAAAGPIAFIALAGPQIAKRLGKTAALSPVTAGLCGAVLLLGADVLSQSAPFGLHMPIGLTTAFFGGIWMLMLIKRG